MILCLCVIVYSLLNAVPLCGARRRSNNAVKTAYFTAPWRPDNVGAALNLYFINKH
jgi:hypothetical protein